MDYLLGDPTLRARLVRAGRRKAASMRWERIAGAVEGIYLEACGMPPAVLPFPVSVPGDAASLRFAVPGLQESHDGTSD